MKLMAAVAALSLQVSAASVGPAPSLAIRPLEFLVGDWISLDGEGEGGRKARGRSDIALAAGGAALIRRDRTELSGEGGTAGSTFEQVMLIYPENGVLRGDYFDGQHVIHYVSSTVVSGRSVTFNTDEGSGKPGFRLTYVAKGEDELTVRFEIKPPGASAYQIIASGDLKRE